MTPDYWSDATRDATIERGLAIYKTDLKAILEPAFARQVVTIHVDSGDYAVGRNSSLASRVLRARQPQGLTVSLDIGEVPVDDPLSQRMRGESVAGVSSDDLRRVSPWTSAHHFNVTGAQ